MRRPARRWRAMSSPGMLTSDLSAIMPLLLMWGLASAVLLLEAFARTINRIIPLALVCIGVIFAGYQLISDRAVWGDAPQTLFAGAVKMDALSSISGFALCVTALLSVLMAYTYLKNRGLEHGEYYALILLSTSGAMLMAMAQD